MTATIPTAKDVGRAAQVGARNAVKPELLATVAGFAMTRKLEVFAYTNARGVFGDNSAPGGLTDAQWAARVALKAVAAIAAAGALIPNRNRLAAGAGVGLAAGFVWHILNDLGVNV